MNQKQVSTIHSYGISTVEVGTVTGEVEVITEVADGLTDVFVAYVGAKDTYRVEGSPLNGEAAHEQIVQHLASEPKRNERGNVVAHVL